MISAHSLASSGNARIVICSADVGCGHGRAAAAISLALRNNWPGIQVKIVDALSMTPWWFNCLYRDAYLFAARRLPAVNGWLYETTDRPGIPGKQDFGGMLESLALKKFCASTQVREADLIVCTHFLCARVLSAARAAGRLNKPLAVVVTDQHPHAVWRVAQADLYIVASANTQAELARHGVPPEQIVVTGIPIDERFHTPLPREQARQRLNLPAEKPVLLLTGGGLGLGGIDHALAGILSTGLDVHTVAVCARNDLLRKQLTDRYGVDHPQCRILGITTRMHELMAAADLHVGKPGGLTTSESAAMGLPMVLLRPIPGQEERNAEVIVQVGAGIRRDDPYEAGIAAAMTAVQPTVLKTLRTNAAGFGRPTSAFDAAAAVMRLESHAPSKSVPQNAARVDHPLQLSEASAAMA